MWLHCTIGWFSAVQHRDAPGAILVRAHTRTEMEALQEHVLPDLEVTRMRAAYGAVVARDEWTFAAERLAAAIDYTEFPPERQNRGARPD